MNKIIIFLFIFLINLPVYITYHNSYLYFDRIISPISPDKYLNGISFHLSSILILFLLVIFIKKIIFNKFLVSLIIIVVFNLLFIEIFLLNNIVTKIYLVYLQILFSLSTFLTLNIIFDKYYRNQNIIYFYSIVIELIIISKFLIEEIYAFNQKEFFISQYIGIYDFYQYWILSVLPYTYIGLKNLLKDLSFLNFLRYIFTIIIIYNYIKIADSSSGLLLYFIFIIIALFNKYLEIKVLISKYNFYILILFSYLLYLIDYNSFISSLSHTLAIRQNILSLYFADFNIAQLLLPLTNDMRVNTSGSLHGEITELISVLGIGVLLYYIPMYNKIIFTLKNNLFDGIFLLLLIFSNSLIANPTIHMGINFNYFIIILVLSYQYSYCNLSLKNQSP